MAAPPAWNPILATAVLEGEPAGEPLFDELAERDRSNSAKPFDGAFAEASDNGGAPRDIVLLRRGDILPPTNRSIRFPPNDATYIEWKVEVKNSNGTTNGELIITIRSPQGGTARVLTIPIDVGDTSYTEKTGLTAVQAVEHTVQPDEVEVQIELNHLAGAGSVSARCLGRVCRTYQDGS